MRVIKIGICTVLFIVFISALRSQNYCDVNGNLMIFTNYDGGQLNINVDVNIPNLKIGIVSYEAIEINLSGTFLSNVSAVVWAGYGGTNNHCGSGTTTSINGTPSTATKAIVVRPNSPITNSYGHSTIICGYSCSTTSSQGGCNTIDQIEAYFLNYFTNSALFAHRVQYGCWTGSQGLASGGTCCANINSLSLTTKPFNESCTGKCDGSVLAGAAGGSLPYNYILNGGSNFSNLCAGAYSVKVTDGSNNSVMDSVVVGSYSSPSPAGDSIQIFCAAAKIADLSAAGIGIQWYGTDTGSNALDSNAMLADGNIYYASQTVNGCESKGRLSVLAEILVPDVSVIVHNNELTASAAGLSYQWLDCNQNYSSIPGMTGRSYHPASNGKYAVRISEGNCSDTSECIELTSVGVPGINGGNDLRIFPNPSGGKITISSASSTIPLRISVYDLWGRLIYEINPSAGNYDEIDLSEFGTGMYIVELKCSEGMMRGIVEIR